jgi:hypothetical protein
LRGISNEGAADERARSALVCPVPGGGTVDGSDSPELDRDGKSTVLRWMSMAKGQLGWCVLSAILEVSKFFQ